MKWSCEFATGIDRIDDQHKILFKMSEDLTATLAEGSGHRGYGYVLDWLAFYAHSHFTFEEGCLYRYRCPVAEKNTQTHEIFLKTVAELKERYVLYGFDRTDAQRLHSFVESWLSEHICSIDLQLKPYVERPLPVST